MSNYSLRPQKSAGDLLEAVSWLFYSSSGDLYQSIQQGFANFESTRKGELDERATKLRNQRDLRGHHSLGLLDKQTCLPTARFLEDQNFAPFYRLCRLSGSSVLSAIHLGGPRSRCRWLRSSPCSR